MRRIKLFAIILALLLTLTACPEQKTNPNAPPLTPEQQAEQIRQQAISLVSKVGDAFRITADSIEQGAPVVRQFRLAGKIKPANSLKAARIAKKIVQVMQKVSDFFGRIDVVSETERRELAADIKDLIQLAEDIKGIAWTDDTGQTSNAQLAFGLTTIAAGSTVEFALRNFQDKMPEGFTVVIPSEVKKKFENARPALDRDLDLLDRSIAELGG